MENFSQNTPSKNSGENKIEVPSIKEGIDFIFEQNPELASIGTKEEYSKYLEIIFPESRVRDIVYHGSQNTPKYFNQNNDGIFFTKDVNYANRYGNKLADLAEDIVVNKSLPIILNIKNPFYPAISISTRSSHKDVYFNPINTPKENDGVIGKDAYAETIGDSIVVFKPEQIHILGSKSDIEKFKGFVSNKL